MVASVAENCVSVTLSGVCAVCLRARACGGVYACGTCGGRASYCCLSHMAADWRAHQRLCAAVRRLGGGDRLQEGDGDAWRSQRVRELEKVARLYGGGAPSAVPTVERDLLLFPRACRTCYERDPDKLVECTRCHQHWYCGAHPAHKDPAHDERWCARLQVYLRLARAQLRGDLRDLSVVNVDPTEDCALKLTDMRTVVRRALHIDQPLGE